MGGGKTQYVQRMGARRDSELSLRLLYSARLVARIALSVAYPIRTSLTKAAEKRVRHKDWFVWPVGQKGCLILVHLSSVRDLAKVASVHCYRGIRCLNSLLRLKCMSLHVVCKIVYLVELKCMW